MRLRAPAIIVSISLVVALVIGLRGAQFARFGLVAAHAQAPDASDLAEGLRLYQQKGNCRACHGWAGDSQATPTTKCPSARTCARPSSPAHLIVMTIKCGRPNSQMPAFDKFAYSDGRCYGKTQADLRRRSRRACPIRRATLQPREIELIVDFMMAKIVGKGPMDHAKCVEFWGSDVDACRDLPEVSRRDVDVPTSASSARTRRGSWRPAGCRT